MLSFKYIIVLSFFVHWNGCAVQAFISSHFRRSSCETISLIHAVPTSRNDELSGWNASEVDLLYRTSSLAVNFINERSNLLPGVKLDIMHVSTDDCIREPPLQDLVELFRAIYKRQCVLGVIGLYCSSVTRVVAELLSHPNFGYIQLSSSTSPLFQNLTKYPYLYRFISSSMLFNQAVISMMDEFNWKNIGLTYDLSNIYFKTTGINFAEQIKNRTDLNLNSLIPLVTSLYHGVLEGVIQEESRINYYSVTHKESADVLCEAYHQNFTWPNYVFILVDDSLEGILASTGKCTEDQLLQAAEGTFLLLHRLTNIKQTDEMDNHYDQYNNDLETIKDQYHGGMKKYANILFDQIWAFAFAANNSLEEIKTRMGNSFEEYIKRSPVIRNILFKKLQKVKFQGVSATIKFNNQQEVQTIVDIYQIQNGSQILVGEYNASVNKLNFASYFDKKIIPEDSFKIRQDAIPTWVGVLVALSQAILLLMLGMTFVFMILWRNSSEIKSTSIRVSILILGGCFIIMLSSLFYNLENFADASTTSITVFCNLESWFFLCGINIILVSLLLRLLRVFIIFHCSKTKMRILKDAHLFLYISLTSVPLLVLLVLWTCLDHLRHVSKKIFVSSWTDPHYSQHFYCSSHYVAVWTGLCYSWISILLIPLLVLAIQTRHVQYNDFKDTKKMSAFIFVVTFILGSLLPLSYLLQNDLPMWAYISKSLLTLLIPSACLAFQYIPKLFPILSRKKLSFMSNDLSI